MQFVRASAGHGMFGAQKGGGFTWQAARVPHIEQVRRSDFALAGAKLYCNS